MDSTYRVLITSDMHCTDLETWNGVSNEDRLQAWVDQILAEHAKQPFDLILIAGDISLDYHDKKTPWDKGYSTGKIFMEQYIPQLPAGVPVQIIAGNHEQYPQEDWKALTGCDRESFARLGSNLFIMLDCFNADLGHYFDSQDVYTPMNVAYIRELMDKYPDCDVWLISHFIWMPLESDEFRKLVAEDARIKGLFSAHTHQCSLIPLGEAYGNKVIAQAGNFSFTGGEIATAFWGLRDLLITPDGAVSRYIQAERDVTVAGKPVHIEARISDIATY